MLVFAGVPRNHRPRRRATAACAVRRFAALTSMPQPVAPVPAGHQGVLLDGRRRDARAARSGPCRRQAHRSGHAPRLPPPTRLRPRIRVCSSWRTRAALPVLGLPVQPGGGNVGAHPGFEDGILADQLVGAGLRPSNDARSSRGMGKGIGLQPAQMLRRHRKGQPAGPFHLLQLIARAGREGRGGLLQGQSACPDFAGRIRSAPATLRSAGPRSTRTARPPACGRHASRHNPAAAAPNLRRRRAATTRTSIPAVVCVLPQRQGDRAQAHSLTVQPGDIQVAFLVLAAAPVLPGFSQGGAAVQVSPGLQLVRFTQRVALEEVRGTVRSSPAEPGAAVGR